MVWLLVVAQMGLPMAWAAFAIFWPGFMGTRFGMPLQLAGPLFGLTSLGQVPAAIFTGWLCTRYPRTRRLLLIGCPLAFVLGSYLMLSTDEVLIVSAGCLLQGVGWGFLPLLGSMPYQLPGIQFGELAVATAILRSASAGAALAGPVIAGLIAQQSADPGLALAVLAPVALASALAAIPEVND